MLPSIQLQYAQFYRKCEPYCTFLNWLLTSYIVLFRFGTLPSSGLFVGSTLGIASADVTDVTSIRVAIMEVSISVSVIAHSLPYSPIDLAWAFQKPTGCEHLLRHGVSKLFNLSSLQQPLIHDGTALMMTMDRQRPSTPKTGSKRTWKATDPVALSTLTLMISPLSPT